MLKTAYGDAALSKTRVYEWLSRFKNGEMAIEDQPPSGSLTTTSRNDETSTKSMLLSVKIVAEPLINFVRCLESIQRILSENLHMRSVADKFIPRVLTDEQRERRLQACLELQNQLKEDSEFFSKVITGDESWCYGHDPETK
ncbi:protein GVQW3-like [Photinus pyralis]|uniref:protein GVQW3-like n=1 Tax=Photinus pyralis TaxID=7054 RepID=UPI001266EB6E|nr:protein GVQW3-like [Photinus pyralis]